MKLALLSVAAVALAGCDITFGANGPVITQSDSIIRQVVPIGAQTTPDGVQPAAPLPQSASQAPTQSASQTIAQTDAPDAPRQTFTLPAVGEVIALPVGVRRSQVNAFKAAVADAGCVVDTLVGRNAIQAQIGVDDERLSRIQGYLRRTGELEQRSGSYRLTSGRCADA